MFSFSGPKTAFALWLGNAYFQANNMFWPRVTVQQVDDCRRRWPSQMCRCRGSSGLADRLNHKPGSRAASRNLASPPTVGS